jgi:hypothetical protein
MQDDRTRELLKQWNIEIKVPANFNSAVWRRIENSGSTSLARTLAAWFNGLFARPAVALSYVVIALVAGLTAGQARASRDLQHSELQLKSKYLQSVDPYAKALAP